MSENNFPEPLIHYHIGEEQLRTKSITLINNDISLSMHIEMIEKSIHLIEYFCSQYTDKNEEQKIVQLLSMHVFNDLVASLKLSLSGYHHSTASLIRNIIETTFLLDDFETNRSHIIEWHQCTNKERKQKFSQEQIRQRLDNRDRLKEQKRREKYQILSELGTHPHPKKFTMLRPDPYGHAHCGIYVTKEMLTTILYELATIGCQYALILTNFLDRKQISSIELLLIFQKSLHKWSRTFLNKAIPPKELIDELEADFFNLET